jgi:hypothetical protein
MSFFQNLFNMNESQQAHETVFGSESRHHSTWTHEVVSGAAGFAGKILMIFKVFFIMSCNFYLFSCESL